MHKVDLIPTHRRQAKARRNHLRRWALAGGGYALVIAVACIYQVSRSGASGVAVAEECGLLASNMNNSRQLMDALQKEMGDKQRRLKAAQAVGKQPNWGVLLAILSRNVGDQVVLDLCRFQPLKEPPTPSVEPARAAAAGKQYLVDVGGFADSQAVVSAFALRLEKTGLFQDIRLVKSTLQPFGDRKVVGFRLECMIRESN